MRIIIQVDNELNGFSLGYKVEPDDSDIKIRKAFYYIIRAAWNRIQDIRPTLRDEKHDYQPVFWDLRNDEPLNVEGQPHAPKPSE